MPTPCKPAFVATVDVTRSAWDRLADADFSPALARIKVALPALAEYGVTPADVAEAHAP